MSYHPLLLALWGFALVSETVSAATVGSWVPGRLSVRFRELPVLHSGAAGLELGVPELDRINHALNGLEHAGPLYKHLERVYEPDLRLNWLLEFDDRLDMESVAALYTETGLVEYAEPDYLRPVYRETSDPDLATQWYLDTIDARGAWDSLPAEPDYPGMIIAVVDTGVDWNHPDLADIIWQNPGEDLDSDTVMSPDSLPGEPDERNGIDDDGNGYIDDFYGWGFVQSNNPMDFIGHGTHCAGITAAATDNAIGVAAAAWGCRVMCLRVGYLGADGNAYVVQSAAANAVVYAIENGARLMNLGFGGSQTVRTPCTVAYNSGLLCFHAAGNDNSSNSDPLDIATGMVTVAATDSGDCMAEFSNHGSWVDVSAPGTNIHNTGFDNIFTELQGTSKACALACSVAALIWSQDSTLTNEQVLGRLLATADNIDHLPCNAPYVNQLGSGRVNANNAVNNIRETTLALGELRLEDADGDGRLLPGEELRFSLSVENTGYNPTDSVEVTLHAWDAGFDFANGQAFPLDAIPGGQSANNFDTPLVFSIEADSAPRYVTFMIQATTANAPRVAEGTIDVMIGDTDLLLYDDDAAISPVHGAYYTALRELGLVFDHYRTATGSFPDLPGRTLDLDDYELVVYASGASAVTLNETERTLFADWSATHPVLFTSQHANVDLAGNAFLSDVLHAANGAGTNPTRGTKGTVGDEVSNGMVMILQGANGANNQASPLDEITPLGGATAFMTEYNQQFPIGVRHDNGTSRMIYLNFALEAAHNTAATMGLADALAIYLDWLGLEVAVEPREEVELPSGISLSPAWPNPFNPVTRLAVELDRAARVELSVYDLRGARVATLLDGPVSAGRHEVVFGGDALASGLYFARLDVEGRPVQTRKIVLAR